MNDPSFEKDVEAKIRDTIKSHPNDPNLENRLKEAFLSIYVNSFLIRNLMLKQKKSFG